MAGLVKNAVVRVRVTTAEKRALRRAAKLHSRVVQRVVTVSELLRRGGMREAERITEAAPLVQDFVDRTTGGAPQ
jgi:hypothetical protein